MDRLNLSERPLLSRVSGLLRFWRLLNLCLEDFAPDKVITLVRFKRKGHERANPMTLFVSNLCKQTPDKSVTGGIMHHHPPSNNPASIQGHIAVSEQQEPTMTSRQIAGLVSKEHKNVKRDIVKMLSALEIDALNFERIYYDSLGRQQVEYALNRDLTDCLITGYSPKARLRVIRRWRELENKALSETTAMIPDFNDPAAMARAWASAYEQSQILTIENKEQSERIELLENHFEDGGTVPEFARTLPGVNTQLINRFLCEELGWLRSDGVTSVRWRMNYKARVRGFLKETERDVNGYGGKAYDITLLARGKAELERMYHAGELPMVKTWDGERVYDYGKAKHK